jgi:signal transduction histidine kinase
MFFDGIIENWSLLYFSELMAFTISILFSIRRRIFIPSIIWSVSNMMAAFSMMSPSVLVETTSEENYNLFSFVVSGASLMLPYFALAGGNGGLFHFHKSFLVFGTAVVVMMASAFLPYGWLPALLGYFSGGVIVLATAWVCAKSRLWRGLWGQSIMVAALAVCSLILFWRGCVVFEGRSDNGFQIDPAKSAFGLQMLVLTSFFLQIGFLSMVVGRELRSRRFMGRRAARLFEINRGLAVEQQRFADLADERLLTLGLLTHEVRQPINNARAALEALDYEIKPDGPNAAKSKKAIGRAQGVLDSITLSISNAIFGTSLLERNTQLSSKSVNACEVAELAKYDCPLDLTPRIAMNFADEAVYVDIDPILIRLALRNLLDNALKYSPTASAIQLAVVRRENRFGVSFTVTSQLSRPDLLNEDIFAQRIRGSGARGEGSGLGLFLVKKVADAHHGTISYVVHDDERVIFDLFIPD